ncbi:polysaccharide lyase 8 family protein, partial [Streptomyces clavuligerus]
TPTSLWPGHPYDPPAGITRSCARLWTMAQGWHHTGDPALLAGVVRGLDHLAATVYHPGTTRYGNWWEWQIGSPRLLLDTVAALGDRLTPDRREAVCAAVDHFIPDALLGSYTGTSTGANRVDLARSVALRGILGRRPAKIALARDALTPVFPHVTAGDGLYADGSFVQHTWVAYSGTYGQVLLDGLARLLALLTGSPWAVTDPRRQLVLDSVEHAFAPLIHNGLMMDVVNGRAVSRGRLAGDEGTVPRGDHFHGHAMIAAIALLAESASPAERDRWHARIRGWTYRDTTEPVLTSPQFGVAALARLHTIAAAPGPVAPEPTGHRLFAAMDRAVHRRPGWAAAVAMASERIAHYECGNGEHPRGWHTGAGMVLWWPADTQGGQYTDAFWPTVDPYRMPGTTVSTRRLPDRAGGEWGEPRPPVRWVGGATDGEYAAVGQQLAGLGSTLTARKSWICADDAIICLGSAIGCRDGVPVETVIDNRNLGAPGSPA